MLESLRYLLTNYVLPYARQVPEGNGARLEHLWSQMNRQLGLKRVFGTSWELLGSWGSTLEAMRAYVVISPDTPPGAGFDFNRFHELAECGRTAAAERIDGVLDSLKAMLEALTHGKRSAGDASRSPALPPGRLHP